MHGEGICKVPVKGNQDLHIIEGVFKNDRFPEYGTKTVKQRNDPT